MTEPTNYWKLGLFVVTGFGLGVAALVFIGSLTLREDVVEYRSYLEEAVTGLESGAGVKFRGVTLGHLTEITIAPDRRHVEIQYELDADTVARLGWTQPNGLERRLSIPKDLRAQLGSTGITGVKYLQLDYFDPKAYPPPKLSFRAPRNYIPAVSSTFKNLEDSLIRFADDFPHITERTLAVLDEIHGLLDRMRKDGFTDQMSSSLKQLEKTLAVLSGKLQALPVEELSQQATATAANLDVTLLKVQGLLDRVDGESGLIASAQRATDSVGDLAGRAGGVGNELDSTLRDLRELAQTAQSFLDALERDSDMLVKGRSEATP